MSYYEIAFEKAFRDFLLASGMSETLRFMGRLTATEGAVLFDMHGEAVQDVWYELADSLSEDADHFEKMLDDATGGMLCVS